MRELKTFIIIVICCVTSTKFFAGNFVSVKDYIRNDVFSQSVINDLQFKRITGNDGLECIEMQSIYQGSDGYRWIGTAFGPFRYDGYQFKSFSNNQKKEKILTSNNIVNISDDGRGNIWVGTNYGLNRIDKRTWKIRKYYFNEYSNCNTIDCMLHTKGGITWLATDGGLYRYDKVKDRFVFYVKSNHNTIIPHCSIKSIVEDAKGNLWIGTWDAGLFRYEVHRGEWSKIPMMDNNNSAQCLLFDKSGKLWIGTWGHGMYVLKNPYDKNGKYKYVKFSSDGKDNNLNSSFIYSLIEEEKSNSIWAGTSSGLSIFTNDLQNIKPFINYPSSSHQTELYMKRGVTSLTKDKGGRIWMCGIGAGAISTSTRSKYFNSYSPTPPITSDIIQCVSPDGNNGVWIGFYNIGLVHLDLHTGKTTLWKNIQKSQSFKINDILTISYNKNGDMFIGTRHKGIFVYRKNGKAFNFTHKNTKWLPNDCVYSIRENSKGQMIIGTYSGLCCFLPDNSGLVVKKVGKIDVDKSYIFDVNAIDDNEYLLSTNNKGIIRIKGDIMKPESMKAELYNHAYYNERKFDLRNILKTLVDKNGRIWACSQESGLLEFDKNIKAFRFVNDIYSIPGNIVSNIENDNNGNLWVATNHGIVRLHVYEDMSKASSRVFTKLDGLPSNYFGTSVSCRLSDGRVVFGDVSNVAVLTSNNIRESGNEGSVYITGIKIYNQPLEEFEDEIRQHITELMPPYIQKMTLEPDQNDFTIEFSTLSYDNPQGARFAYMLEGFDKEWKNVDNGQHSAYYSNLPSGTYKFRIKATDDRGIWSNKEMTISIVILPPLWLRWWAYLIYLVAAVIIVYYLYRNVQNREKQRREIILAKKDSENIKELNHKNLQFFKNITHDLMTPLTIISASVDEMNLKQKSNDLNVIKSNVNRLISLLQQMLTFRMAETEKEDKAKMPEIIGEAEIFDSEYEEDEEENGNAKAHILLVEDNAELLSVITRLFEREYVVTTSVNGKEALEIVANDNTIDIIVSDITMPVMDGLELTKSIKNNIETSHIPVLLLTAKRSEEDMTKAYNVGADAYVTKPFNTSLLDARIRNLLRSKASMAYNFKKKMNVDVKDIGFGNIDGDFINKVIDIVKKHISDYEFDQQVLANEMGMSRSTLYKKLNSLTDMNTPTFIRNVRMKAAMNIIEENPNIRISDLAYAVGYNSLKYFSYSFKKEFGVIPSAYIDNKKK